MFIENLFHEAPFPAVYAGTVVFVLFSIILGFLLGKRSMRRGPEPNDSHVSAIAGATLGLLAFILSFTFSMTANRFETRKVLLRTEATAIVDVYLRSDLLEAPQAANTSRMLMVDYLEARTSTDSPEALDKAIAESEAIHEKLWVLIKQASSLLPEHQDPEMLALYVDAVNELVSLHLARVTVGLATRIPGGIWLALYVVMLLAMFSLGYQMSVTGTRRVGLVLVPALAFSVVMLLIFDLDRPTEGLLKVRQSPLEKLYEKYSGGTVEPATTGKDPSE